MDPTAADHALAEGEAWQALAVLEVRLWRLFTEEAIQIDDGDPIPCVQIPKTVAGALGRVLVKLLVAIVTLEASERMRGWAVGLLDDMRARFLANTAGIVEPVDGARPN